MNLIIWIILDWVLKTDEISKTNEMSWVHSKNAYNFSSKHYYWALRVIKNEILFLH